MLTHVVRISPESHAKLRELANQVEKPMVTVLEKAIEEYRRAQFLRRANEDFARLRKDSKAWREETRERKAWDKTIADGLEKE